jgi:micrococcal nuclease
MHRKRAVLYAKRNASLEPRQRDDSAILFVGGNLDFEFVPCACSPGTEETPACNYGRRCGMLKANGRDLGAILIEERLAVPFVCSGTRCPKTPRPWCEQS